MEYYTVYRIYKLSHAQASADVSEKHRNRDSFKYEKHQQINNIVLKFISKSQQREKPSPYLEA